MEREPQETTLLAERYKHEPLLEETIVEILQDKMLAHDPCALFESRWRQRQLEDPIKLLATITSAAATGILLATVINKPYMLPLAFVPGRIRDILLGKYKESKRGKLLQPREYPMFRI